MTNYILYWDGLHCPLLPVLYRPVVPVLAFVIIVFVIVIVIVRFMAIGVDQDDKLHFIYGWSTLPTVTSVILSSGTSGQCLLALYDFFRSIVFV